MNATIIATIISSAFTLIGTIITVIVALQKSAAETDKKIAVIETKVDDMKEDIKSHNQYAKMFSENIPAINQHMTDVDRRLEALERRTA